MKQNYAPYAASLDFAFNHAPNKVSLLFSTLYIGDPFEKHLLSTLVAS